MMHEKISPLVECVTQRQCWKALSEEKQKLWLQFFESYLQTAERVLRGRNNSLTDIQKKALIGAEEPVFSEEGISQLCQELGQERGNTGSFSMLAKGTITRIFEGLAWGTEDPCELGKRKRRAVCEQGSFGIAPGRQRSSRPLFPKEPNTGVGES